MIICLFLCFCFTVKSEVSEDADPKLEERVGLHGLFHGAHNGDDGAGLTNNGVALRGVSNEVEEDTADKLAEHSVLDVLLHGVQAHLHRVQLHGLRLGLLAVLRQDPQQPAPVQARVRDLHVQPHDLHRDGQQPLLQR